MIQHIQRCVNDKACLWVVLICFGLTCLSSISAVKAEAATLNILTTTSDLASIAKSIAGDRAHVESIANGQRDPHFLQAKPSYILKARNADLWIRIGMELEIGWERPIIDGSRNNTIREGSSGHLDASEKILRLGIPDQRVTRAMGDVHPLGNPHYWLDPLNGRIVSESIADRLSKLFPEYAEEFKKNLNAFQKTLDERMFGKSLVEKVGGEKLWTLQHKGELVPFLESRQLVGQLGGWMEQMMLFHGEKIITYHKSWVYLADRFGLMIVDELEDKPGIPPSPGHVLQVIKKVKDQKISILLMEPYYSRKAPDLIASKSDIRVVVTANSVGGDPSAKDYLSMIGNVITRLETAFVSTHKE